jgi:hypothetical protein
LRRFVDVARKPWIFQYLHGEPRPARLIQVRVEAALAE